MIRITITADAYRAIERTLPGAVSTVGVEREADEKGNREIWPDPHVLAKLRALRGPGESYSDVILRLAEAAPK
jgi:predicted CopG family antitoxin